MYMKKSIKILLIAFIALTSCSKKGDEPTPVQPTATNQPTTNNTTPCGNSGGKNNLNHCEQYQEWYTPDVVKFSYSVKSVTIGASDSLVLGQKDSTVNATTVYDIMNSGKSIVTDSINHSYVVKFNINVSSSNSVLTSSILNTELWNDNLPNVNFTLNKETSEPYHGNTNMSYKITDYKLIGKWYDNIDAKNVDIYFYVAHVVFEYDDTNGRHYKYENDMIISQTVVK